MRRLLDARRNPALLPAMAVVAVALVSIGTVLVEKNWMRGAAWDGYDVVLVSVRLVGGVLGLGVGWWWWWRAPANPTGRLLYLAAAADWLALICYCWPASSSSPSSSSSCSAGRPGARADASCAS